MNEARALTYTGPSAFAVNTHHAVPTQLDGHTSLTAGSSGSVVEPCSTTDCVSP